MGSSRVRARLGCVLFAGLALSALLMSSRALASTNDDKCRPLMASSGPTIEVTTFGAKGDGITDDSIAIQTAIDSLSFGDTLVFPPGRYLHNRVLTVSTTGVTLQGQDARLEATNPALSALIVRGERTTIRDLAILTRDAHLRGDQPRQSAVVVYGHKASIVRNAISGSENAGILVLGASDYVIACNRVFDTLSDGIHSTDGATHGVIRWNKVTNSGDDGIAIVSYQPAQRASDIIIEDNEVSNIRWGRGISVIGSVNAVVRNNSVHTIAMAAGIIVARESSYGTPGSRNVLIEDNRVSDIQKSLAPLSGRRRTGHAAIEINSDGAEADLAVEDIRVTGNSIDGSAYDGVRLLGNVCDIDIVNNSLSNIGGRPIRRAYTRCAKVVRQCQNNAIHERPTGCE